LDQRIPLDPDKGVTDLIGQLTGDSKRLLADEVKLAKLEAAESVHRAGRGALWLGLAFGVVVVTLMAFTLLFATLIGRVANGHYWVGAMLTAVLELALGMWLVRRGLKDFRSAPYAMPATRATFTLAKH